MGVSYHPTIVSNGLIGCIDIYNPRCYLGVTGIQDLSLNKTIYSMSNQNMYSSSGFLNFSGVNQVNMGLSNFSITSGTIETWFRAINDGFGLGSYRGIMVKQSAWGLFLNGDKIASYDWGGASGILTNQTAYTSGWIHLVMSFTQTGGTPSNNASIYFNGSLIQICTIRHSTHTAPLLLGYGNAASQYLTGSISSARVYNRPLSQQEIIQNYNALKGRYQ